MGEILRVFAISDIHTDYASNLDWLLAHESAATSINVLVVAGDVSDDPATLQRTFTHLVGRFDVVAFVPGNHDVWLRPGDNPGGLEKRYTSLDKYKQVLNDLASLGVQTGPFAITLSHTHTPTTKKSGAARTASEDEEKRGRRIDERRIDGSIHESFFIPIQGWHGESFDLEPEVSPSSLDIDKFPSLDELVSDRRRCLWPPGVELLDNTRKQRCDCASTHLCGGPHCCRCLEEWTGLTRKYNCRGAAESPVEPTISSHGWEDDAICANVDMFNDREVVKFSVPPSATLNRKLKALRSSGLFTGNCAIRQIPSDTIWLPHAHFETRADVLARLTRSDPGTTTMKLITYSHFLPFPMVNPEKRFLFYPLLAKVIGSRLIGARAMKLMPDCHIFGHTHFGWNARLDELSRTSDTHTAEECDTAPPPQQSIENDIENDIEKTRFIQAPLGYPRERAVRARSMTCGDFVAETNHQLFELYSVEADGTIASRSDNHFAYWSNFYKKHKRDPTNVTPAQYVVDIYKKTQLSK